MPRRKQRSAFDQVSEFDRGRIVAYREIVDDLSGKSVVVLDETKQLQIVRTAVTECSVTSRTIAQHIESNASFSVCEYHSTPFTAEWPVLKTSIAWSTLDAEPQTSPPPMV
ncbi:uncharacterized protein TNCV_1729331 [Trichonephila clavipes]|nr:uncharacterized protein TNCV_1729331 [Trichonephila clavipes]